MGISPACSFLSFPLPSNKFKCFSVPNQDKVQWYIAVSQIQRLCSKVHFSSHFSSRSWAPSDLVAETVRRPVRCVDAAVVLDGLGLELLPVLGEVGGLLLLGSRGSLAGLLDAGAGSGGDGAAGRVGAGGAGGVEGGVCGVHLVVVLLEGGPQLVGVGLALGRIGHAGDYGVVARCLQRGGGRGCGCARGCARGRAVVGGVGLVHALVVSLCVGDEGGEDALPLLGVCCGRHCCGVVVV
jgi:hypothetical protein